MKVRRIEITFPFGVELTDEQMYALGKVADHICKLNCPHGSHLWPSGVGQKPIFSQADAMFLGEPVDPNAPETGEPQWDEEVFQISCSTREVYDSEKCKCPDCRNRRISHE